MRTSIRLVLFGCSYSKRANTRSQRRLKTSLPTVAARATLYTNRTKFAVKSRVKAMTGPYIAKGGQGSMPRPNWAKSDFLA